MTESPFSIARYFLGKSAESGIEITPMKLIKLVYIAHGWHLGLTGRPLLNEPAEAWKYGPVIPSLYRTYKGFGNGVIPPEVVYGPEAPKHLHEFLDSVWNAYSRYSGGQLSTLTHQQGTPWFKVWKEEGGELQRGAEISDSLIAEHYREKANAGK